MITQLLYISKHDGKFVAELENFMPNIRVKNSEANISSILLSTIDHYIHLIEGTRYSVNVLYNKINKDTRHCDCTILRYVDVKHREFEMCTAEYVDMSSFNVNGINLLSPNKPINIDTITSSHAVTIIRRIHAHLQVKYLQNS